MSAELTDARTAWTEAGRRLQEAQEARTLATFARDHAGVFGMRRLAAGESVPDGEVLRFALLDEAASAASKAAAAAVDAHLKAIAEYEQASRVADGGAA